MECNNTPFHSVVLFMKLKGKKMVELTVGYYSAVDEEKRWISMWQEYRGLCPHCKEGNDSSTPKLGVGC